MASNRVSHPGEVVAIILAAGRGTRMGKLTETLPKPLVPVLEKPALHWVIDGFIASGITRFVIVTGYLSEQVRASVSQYISRGIEATFVYQDKQLGTGHAMALTREAVNGAPAYLAFADIITSPENYGRMIQQFTSGDCGLVAAVRDAGDPWRAAAVYVDDNHIIQQIIEKPSKGTSTTPWSHAGMYCFSNAVYDYIDRLSPSARGEYEITDAVQMMIKDRLCCKAVELRGYWKDLATPDDIAEAEQMIAKSSSEPDAP